MSDSPWTEQVSDRCMALAVERWSATQIANKLHAEYGVSLTRNAVIGRVHRMNGTLNSQAGRERSLNPVRPYRPSESERKRVRALLEKAVQLELPNIAAEPEPELVAEPEETPSPRGLTFMELKDDRSQCRYTKSDGPAWLFCGEPTGGESSYCADCKKIVYERKYTTTEEVRERKREKALANRPKKGMRTRSPLFTRMEAAE